MLKAIARVTRHDHDAYSHGRERPLGGYAVLLGTYLCITGGAAALLHRKGKLPTALAPADLALLAVTTHRLARLLTKDSIGAVARAPFTRYEEPAGEGEVNESVRGEGLRHAVGELVTCPFCLGQWAATGLTVSQLLAPRLTRFGAAICVAASASDWMQLAYDKAKQSV